MSTEFRVWAPRARQVELELSRRRVAMRPAAGGWWFAEPDGAGPGSDYAFVLDGGEPRPDPRSAWQPHGVHGRSRVLEPAVFEWHDPSVPARRTVRRAHRPSAGSADTYIPKSPDGQYVFQRYPL